LLFDWVTPLISVSQYIHLGITIASSQTAANAGASVRNLATGLTNHNGLLAPLLVQADFRGEPNAFKAVFGRVLGDSFSDDMVTDLGDEFYITRNYFKLHACSRWNHAPIEAMTSLLADDAFDAESVDRILVWTYDPATRLNWQEPVNEYAAKHSIPYCVAARIVLGRNDLAAYTPEAVANPQIQSLAKRVDVKEDPALTAMLPDVRPARVEVRLRTGQVLSETVERPRGGFDNPLTEDELADKFRSLANHVLPNDAIVDLEQQLQRLPRLSDLSSVSRLLRMTKPLVESDSQE
jgi:2-methylcitrate dehydratase PrpD